MDNDTFERVATLVARETGVRRSRISLATLIEDDLGCTGFDASDLMNAFARDFHVDMAEFCFDRHFNPELPATPWSLIRGLVIWAATRGRGTPSPDPVTVARLVGAAEHGRWT